MTTAPPPDLPLGVGHEVDVMSKTKQSQSQHSQAQVHTPPTTDEGSHKDDDAASSSSLSELGDDIEDEENRMRFEEAARAGAEAEQHTEVKPDRYENGIPIFQPTMEEFKDFEKYVTGVNPYGMQSGIVLIDPPEEWKQARKALDEMIKTIKIKNPITQEFHGAQGVYTQRNMEKMRSYTVPQWRALCEQTENQPPARRGEKRLNADKLIGRGSVKSRTGEASPLPEGAKRRGRPPRNSQVQQVKDEPVDQDSSLLAPPTPTSPDVKAASLPEANNEEAEEATDPTPTKRKRGRQPGFKPKPRQPKTTVKKEKESNKGSETTVASRRLQANRFAADEVDEEAFKNFDYRVNDNDQWTPERCDELEDKYWKSLNFSNPMYGADMAGSLFDDHTKEWNVAKLPNLLDLLGQPIPGVNTAYLYLGMWRATFAWHLEDVDLYSINYIHFGAPKQWYSISQKDAPKFEAAMKSIWGSDAKACDQFLRHKTYLVSPQILKSKFGVTVNKVVHREGQFVITFPIGYHSGYNLGYNCAESVNFAIPEWLDYGKTAKKCQCEADSVFIDVDWFVRKMNGEPTPEYEEVEVTDDEDDDDVVDLPTPPGSERGKIKVPSKRKRATKDVGPNKKVKRTIKIRRLTNKHQPCCLCPNDFSWEELLPTTHDQKAHRTCAMYTPETYIGTRGGREMVFNVENISKARMELKCYECRLKKGSCFQCSSAKCTKSYHATCAMQAGVQVDKGDIAVWHEGVEYRDIGFDWRCRLHRSVKRNRITSELSTCNHANSCWDNREFKEYLDRLAPGDLVQYQPTNSDDIEAGLVVAGYDPGQSSILLKVLPELNVAKEIEPAWILFVDSSTSCLQKPSANALDLPEALQGKTASMTDSSDRKPSGGDPFTENPKTEWAEFVSAQPPFNKLQKQVDLSKHKQVWLYLGDPSSDTKAHYTADPTKKVHDPASNFLPAPETSRSYVSSLTPAKRYSMGANYPMINIAARNAAMANMKQQAAAYGQQGYNTFQSGHNLDAATLARAKAAEIQKAVPVKRSHYDVIAEQEAKANEQARILQRQQAKAQELERQDQMLNGQKSGTGIGIDRDAVERQRQFQLYAAQQSRTYTQPNGNLVFAGQHSEQGSARHSPQLNFGSDWLYSAAPQQQQQPSWQQSQIAQSASPPIGQQRSPSLNTSAFPAYVQQSDLQFSHDGSGQTHRPSSSGSHHSERMQNETARIDSIRAAANQPPPPPPSAAVERQRRISNPAYPFKSPDQIKARREAEKNVSPNSRPTSSYTLPSPITKHEALPFFGPRNVNDTSPIPQFINPNATQISPPGSSGGMHSASNSMSAGTGLMGPPMQPQLKRSMSGGISHDAAAFQQSFLPPVSNYVPRRSIYDPLYAATHGSQSMISSHSNDMMSMQLAMPIRAPMAEPSPNLVNALLPRAVLSNGIPVNDRAVPPQLLGWQTKGGFWGKVANYYVGKHEVQATVYRSPFAAVGERDRSGTAVGLAQGFYEGLSLEDKGKVDDEREHAVK